MDKYITDVCFYSLICFIFQIKVQNAQQNGLSMYGV